MKVAKLNYERITPSRLALLKKDMKLPLYFSIPARST